MDVDRASAEVWSSWFRCLGDASRVLILNRLAVARRPMSVGEIVEAIDIGQPTVSQRANVRLYRVNEHCMELFPSAAEVVMGQLPRYDPVPIDCRAPWQTAEGTASTDDMSAENAPRDEREEDRHDRRGAG